MTLCRRAERCSSPNRWDTPGAEAIGDAYFGFYLLAMGSGRARRRAELAQLLQVAGFTGIRFLPSTRPMFASVLTGRRM